MEIGVVVIGRNEGSRLKASLLSAIARDRRVVYVDSGSTDGSVELARSLGVDVVELDLSIPFTAGRGRNAGFEYLLRVQPEVKFVQFLDGDCRLVEGWLERAVNEFVANPDIVVVCGRRREEFADRSIYNRLCDVEWATPIGEASACGGDSMMRVSALKKVGGFNPIVIAGEEPELCLRLRQNGGKILRIDAEMTLHDAAMLRFGQWWKRSIRSGCGFAQGAWLYRNNTEKLWIRESLRCWFWAGFVPLLAIATLSVTRGLSVLFLLIVYALLAYRVYRLALVRGFEKKDAVFYALFCTIEKYPQLFGQVEFHVSRLLKRERRIVEYKQGVG